MNLFIENWVVIQNYNNYAVSNFGRVRNIKTGKVLKNNLDAQGYFHVRLYNDDSIKLIKVHRLVASYFLPNFEDLPIVDHIDGNKQNNDVINLRWCNHSNNGMNRIKQANTTSQYKGVSWHKKAKKWYATIKNNGHSIFLGLFDCEEDAGRAYNNKAIEVCGEFAKINTL